VVSNLVIAEGFTYEVIQDVRDGFNEEAFLARYSDILTKYDYIVGDWGYGQLRLKGFFDDKNQKSTYDTKISTLQDYLFEYCNFGCAYFIVQKTGRAPERVVEEVLDETPELKTEQVNQQKVDIELEETVETVETVEQ
jgi:uncharacterized protein YutD